jgi:hypothetical protein
MSCRQINRLRIFIALAAPTKCAYYGSGAVAIFSAQVRATLNGLKDDVRDLMNAADEVVWALYAAAFDNLGEKVPPPPLPYLEPLFGAQSSTKTRVPPALGHDPSTKLSQTRALCPLTVLDSIWLCSIFRLWRRGRLGGADRQSLRADVDRGRRPQSIRHLA